MSEDFWQETTGKRAASDGTADCRADGQWPKGPHCHGGASHGGGPQSNWLDLASGRFTTRWGFWSKRG